MTVTRSTFAEYVRNTLAAAESRDVVLHDGGDTLLYVDVEHQQAFWITVEPVKKPA